MVPFRSPFRWSEWPLLPLLPLPPLPAGRVLCCSMVDGAAERGGWPVPPVGAKKPRCR